MILELYLSLFGISLILLFIGYYAKLDILKVLSYGLIFILGVVVLGYGDTLQYETHTTITEINSTYSMITPSYGTYSNKTFGFLLSTLAFFGWVSVYFEYSKRG